MVSTELAAGPATPDHLWRKRGSHEARSRPGRGRWLRTDRRSEENSAKSGHRIDCSGFVSGHHPEKVYASICNCRKLARAERLRPCLRTGSEAQSPISSREAGASLRARLGIATVSPAELDKARAALPSDPQAAQLYSEALAKSRTFDLLGARDLLVKAITVDPNHALSHSLLAESLFSLGYDTQARRKRRRPSIFRVRCPARINCWLKGDITNCPTTFRPPSKPIAHCGSSSRIIWIMGCGWLRPRQKSLCQGCSAHHHATEKAAGTDPE